MCGLAKKITCFSIYLYVKCHIAFEQDSFCDLVYKNKLCLYHKDVNNNDANGASFMEMEFLPVHKIAYFELYCIQKCPLQLL